MSLNYHEGKPTISVDVASRFTLGDISVSSDKLYISYNIGDN